MGEAFIAALFAYLVYGGLEETAATRRHRIRRRIRRARQTTIEAFPKAGARTVVGTVVLEGDSEMHAPISYRRCVAHEVVVDEVKGNKRKNLLHVFGGIPFRILDRTGAAVVEPGGGRFALELSFRSDPRKPLDTGVRRQAEFLEKHKIAIGRYEVREGVLTLGTRVAIRAHGVREPDPTGVASVQGYRSAPPMRLRLSGTSRARLLISDSAEVVDP